MRRSQTGGRSGDNRNRQEDTGCRNPYHGTSWTDTSEHNKFGTYTVRAREEEEAKKLISDAHAIEEAGCFSIVLEKIPAQLAERVTKELNIPVIGIGAGGACDGQVLVVSDMLGMTKGFSPKFLRRYADLNTVMTDAIGHYIEDVKNCDFPNESEQY